MRNFDIFNENNLTVIPVLPRSKSTSVIGWQLRRLEDNNPGEFKEDSNFGVVLGSASNNLVDIDLDCELARLLAPHFLPNTGWVFGRKTALRSHYLYKVTGDAGGTKRFVLDGESFAEYRADGGYTVFPPSIHKGTGEIIEFEVQTELGESTREELLDCLTLMTICAIVLPSYVEGSRHDLVLCLSGTLLSHGKSEEQVLHLIDVLSSITDDEESSNRLDAVRDTAARLAKGQLVSQAGRLVDLVGKDASSKILKLLGRQSPAEKPVEAQALPGLLPPDEQNDTGVATLFARQVENEVFYHNRYGCFFVYRNGIWKADEQGIEVASKFDDFVQKQIARIRTDTSGIPPDQCATQTRFLLKYRNRSNATNAIAQSRPFLAIDAIDEQDDHLAAGNGLLNLQDGTLLPFSPGQYVTKQTAIEYSPEAKCPLFEQVLADALGGDAELITYFQGIMGYWLTGQANRQEFYILHGSGANGKSTILNAITHVLGPYAGSLMSETIFEGSGSQHSSDLASMQDYRLAVVHEAESQFRLNASRIKQLTGQDTVKVRALYKAPISFKPKFKIVVVCNKRPNLDAYDDGLKRRIKLIPFDNVVPSNKRDPKLGERLEKEASGILNFLIEGARMYFNDEIREPQAVREATNSYLGDQDSITSFLQDCTVQSNGCTVGKGDLYDAYVSYCTDEAVEAVAKGEFGRILKKMNYTDTRKTGERQWKGLRLATSGEEIFPGQRLREQLKALS